jgi:LEA14-like dessication related protein
MNIMTLTKTTKLDYRDFVRDENNNLVHKSKIKNNNNTSISIERIESEVN